MSKTAEISLLFLKLGCIGFGGPAAHIAMMEQESVSHRKWLPSEQFTEGLTLCNLLPGPTSTQLAIWLGYQRGGIGGALLAGVCFILPAFAMLLGLTWLYFHYGTMPGVQKLFAGIAPTVIAIIIAACHRLSKTAVKKWPDILILISALLLTCYGIEVALTLLAAGLIGILRSRLIPKMPTSNQTAAWGMPLLLLWSNASMPRLFFFFLKVGALLFGGGLVIIPFLRHEVVDIQGWMTAREFTDGVALGQVTPGPVVITATFIGYKVAGWTGAIMATLAIFLPSFVFILLAAPQMNRIRKLDFVKAFLKGVSPAVVGAILASCLPMARSIYISAPVNHLWFPISILVISLPLLIKTKVGAIWIILGGGILGLLFG